MTGTFSNALSGNLKIQSVTECYTSMVDQSENTYSWEFLGIGVDLRLFY